MIVRRRPRPQIEAPGQDSFLDVVTNILGILIILVMVIGVRAQKAANDVPAASIPAPSENPTKASDPAQLIKQESDAVQRDILASQQQMAIDNQELLHRQQLRLQMLRTVEAARKAVDEHHAKLDDAAKAEFDVRRNLAMAQDELLELKRKQGFLSKAKDEAKILEHYPTPMAKTVFGHEEHFRLLDGKLTYVPMNELLDILKSQWSRGLHRLQSVEEYDDSCGPVGGFMAKYKVARETMNVETRYGTAQQAKAIVAGFHLVQITDDDGEKVADALKPDSRFNSRIKGYDRDRVTVTIWTYPNSFDDFRAVKEHLLKRGFLTAGRPIPAGMPIGGSPQGSKSAAQ